MYKCNVKFLFIFLSCVLLKNPSEAQIQVGLAGGMNRSNFKAHENSYYEIEQENFKKQSLIALGLVCDYQFTGNFYFHIEAMYLQKGTKYINYDNNRENVLRFNISYFEIPLFLKAVFGHKLKFYAQAGPAMAYCMDGEVEIHEENISGVVKVKNLMENIDFCFGIGGGISWTMNNISFFLESNYRHGLVNVFKGGKSFIDLGIVSIPYELPPMSLKTRGLLILSGITIPLKMIK